MSSILPVTQPQHSSAELDVLLAEHAVAIRDLGKRTRENIIENTIEIGRHLVEVRDDLGHGAWLAWVAAEFGWSDQTAYRFIHLYDLSLDPKFHTCVELDLPLRVLYLLAAPKAEEAREKITAQIESGEPVTKETVIAAVTGRRKLPVPAEPDPADPADPDPADPADSAESGAAASAEARKAAYAASEVADHEHDLDGADGADVAVHGEDDQPELAGDDQPEPAGDDQPELAGDDQPEPAGDDQPELAGDDQPEPAGDDQPELAGDDQPEPAGDDQPELAGDDQPEPAGDDQPELAGDDQPEPAGDPPSKLSAEVWCAATSPADETVKTEIIQGEELESILARMSETQKDKLFDRLVALQIRQAKLASKSADDMLKSLTGTFWYAAGQDDPQKIAEAVTVINGKLKMRGLSAKDIKFAVVNCERTISPTVAAAAQAARENLKRKKR